MKKEADVKAEIKKILNAIGAWWFMYVPTGYGVSGIPDFLVCYKGHFLTIEAKYGKNKPTPLQNVQMDKITMAGGVTLIIDEYNVKDLSIMITEKCS